MEMHLPFCKNYSNICDPGLKIKSKLLTDSILYLLSLHHHVEYVYSCMLYIESAVWKFFE